MKNYPTQYDLSVARAACMRELGWEVEVDPDGVSRTEVPEAQDDVFNADSDACLKQLGVDTARALTDQEVSWLYEYSRISADCLRDAGYAVEDTPSFQRFRDLYATNPWFPWSGVPPEQAPAAIEKCPTPPALY
jgi:hypothetical protein